MRALQPPSRIALAALALALGIALVAFALRAPDAPAALASERNALLGLVDGASGSGATAAAPLGAPSAQVGFGSWTLMRSAEATSAPSAVSWGPGRLDVFVRGRNGELYQNYRDRSGPWSGWRVPEAFRGVVLRSAPSCAAWRVERISCVALIEGSREVWHFFWDGRAWARQSLGGEASSAPSVVSPGANQLAVFVAGGGNRLFGQSWVRDQWSGWRDLGGVLQSAPACAAFSGDAAIECFVTSTQGWIMRQRVRVGQNLVEPVGSFQQVSLRVQSDNDLTLGSAPAATAVRPGRIALMVLNNGQILYSTTWTGSDQVIWQRSNDPFSPMLNSAPSCAASSTALECFARGPDSPMLNGFGDIMQSVAGLP